MLSKLTAQGSNQNRLFKQKCYQGKRRGQSSNYYDQDRYQNNTDETVEIGEYHTEVELSMDKIMMEGHSIIKIIEVILEEVILEEHRIIKVRILEVDIEVTLGTIL